METQKQQKLTLTKRSDLYKIVIPDSVEKQIRFLCSQVWSTEWSGVLFYTYSGTFEDNNLVIKCVDILPMDIGSTAYTEFNMSPDVISYMAQKPELLDCQTGLIHSHNNMATFFSGTDTATLLEEGSDRNHFVSLIVNNAGNYTAGITRRVTYEETRKVCYPSYEGKTVCATEEFAPQSEVEWFNLEIIKEGPAQDRMQEIADRLAEIKKTKAATTPVSSTPKNPYTGSASHNAFGWEGSLWDEEDVTSFPTKAPKESTIPEEFSKYLTEKDIETIFLDLLTGNITVTADSKLDVNNWVKQMESVFDKRFAKDKDLKKFNDWATGHVEYLMWFSIDFPMELNDEISAYIAETIADKLEKLPQNKYIKEYISILNTYIYGR